MTPWKIVQNRQNLICLMLEWKNISMLKNSGVKDQNKISKKKSRGRAVSDYWMLISSGLFPAGIKIKLDMSLWVVKIQ